MTAKLTQSVKLNSAVSYFSKICQAVFSISGVVYTISSPLSVRL